MMKHRFSSGFSMLEMSLVLGISGALVSGAWQMMTTANLQGEAQGIASQTLRIGQAAQNYINNNSGTLLALVPTLNSAVKVKLSSTDTGSTADSVIEAGYLPDGFNLTNAYQQNYAFYIQRIDAGTLGAADPADRLVGLLITKDNGSTPMTDKLGAILSATIGTAGGFIYLQDHTAYTDTANLARGTNGNWQINLSGAPWSSLIGADGKPGHLAVMTNLLPNGTSASASSGGGGSSIDDLSDGKTDYATDYNLFIGENSGDAISGGQYNTGAGYQALQNLITGSNNQALGYQALKSVVDGSDNIAAGSMALQNLIDGKENVAVGYQSLLNNVSGSHNVAHGFMALKANTVSGNTAVGYEAMLSNDDGLRNTAVGHNALKTNVSGADNTAIGSNSLKLIEGSFNTAVGSLSMSNFTAGNRNTALGYATMNGAGGGDDNTAIGSYALSALQTGSQNTALGMSALMSTTTGSSNTALGYAAGMSNTTGSRNTIIGAEAWKSQTAGNDNTIAGYKAASLVTNCSGVTIAGYEAANSDTDCPSYSSALGYHALYQATFTGSGAYTSVMGYNAMPALNNNSGASASGFGYNVYGTQSSMSGDVGIGAGARALSSISYFQVGVGSGALPKGGLYNNPIAIGYQAFKAYLASDIMTSPANGVAIGYQSLLAATNYFQLAVGANSGMGIVSQSSPSYLIGAYSGNTGNMSATIGMGYQAAKLTAGGTNIVIGSNALATLPASATATQSSGNVVIGFEAGKLLTGATTSTLVGAQSASAGAGAHYATAIGFQAMKSGETTTSSGDTCTGFGSNVNFGYAGLVATCTRNTAFGYAANFGNRTGTDNVAIGYMALANLMNGSYNTAIGSQALGQMGTLAYNTAVGYKAGYDNNSLYSNTTTIGYNAQVGGSNEVRFGDTNVTWIGGQVIFSALSDRRDKRDIADLDLGLNFIRKLRPVSFRMNNGNEKLDYGFIAQEVQEALGERKTNLVVQRSDERGSYVMRYNDLIAPVVKGLQEQHGNLKQAARGQQALEKQAESFSLTTLKAQLEADQARLATLKARQH